MIVHNVCQEIDDNQFMHPLLLLFRLPVGNMVVVDGDYNTAEGLPMVPIECLQ